MRRVAAQCDERGAHRQGGETIPTRAAAAPLTYILCDGLNLMTSTGWESAARAAIQRRRREAEPGRRPTGGGGARRGRRASCSPRCVEYIF